MKPRIVALGEVLWDLLPSGPVLGGAPANFACHARALGADTTLVSRVGDDELGREILRRLPHDSIQIDYQRPTGTVAVDLDTGQPHYTIRENVAWDAIEFVSFVRAADAVCFGSLAQRSTVSRDAIQRMVNSTRPETARVFDINLRQSFYSREVIEQSLVLANVLKLNDAELAVIEKMFALRGIDEIAARFDLRVIALTRGSEGSVLWENGARIEHPGVPTTVCDTIGAGDSFTAALTLGLLADHSLDRIIDHASRVASYVCSQSGATPALPPALLTPK